jgi:hypothetical protein
MTQFSFEWILSLNWLCQKWGQVQKLAWLLDMNGFYDFKSRYDRSITHGVLETTRVTRYGRRYEVSNYADAGPFDLWVIQRAVESVASFADWEDTTKTKLCPSLR